MDETLSIMIDIARNSDAPFTPITKTDNELLANQTVHDLTESCDVEDVVFSSIKEKDMYYIVIGFREIMKCGGQPDKYCEKCKVVHFDNNGLNASETTNKKKEFYGNWYKSIRDKGSPETK